MYRYVSVSKNYQFTIVILVSKFDFHFADFDGTKTLTLQAHCPLWFKARECVVVIGDGIPSGNHFPCVEDWVYCLLIKFHIFNSLWNSCFAPWCQLLVMSWILMDDVIISGKTVWFWICSHHWRKIFQEICSGHPCLSWWDNTLILSSLLQGYCTKYMMHICSTWYM